MQDDVREDRITMEIVVDAYGPEKIINLATNIAELLVCAVMMRFNVLSLVLISYRPTR